MALGMLRNKNSKLSCHRLSLIKKKQIILDKKQQIIPNEEQIIQSGQKHLITDYPKC